MRSSFTITTQTKFPVFLGLVILFLPLLAAGCGKGQQPAVWGRVDAKEVDVNSKVPGRVAELLVRDGQEVQKGQLLARIDSRDIKAKVDQAKAQSQVATVAASQAGTATQLQDQVTQASLVGARAQLDKAAADLALAKKNYERFTELYKAGAVSQLTVDNAKLSYDVSLANYGQAQAGVTSAQANLMQQQLSRDNEAASVSKLAQAEAALDEATAHLDETEIRAPIAGVVTDRMVEQGELVSTGTPLMTIQDPQNNWVNVKVKETDLNKYTLNNAVNLQGQNKDLRLIGTIVDISKKPEFATYRATDERNQVDVTTYNVKIQVNSGQVRPGMRLAVIEGDA